MDEVELGHPLEERVRIAVNIDDLEEATEAVRATGNGQRATGNGQRATGNGQRATGNG